MTPLTPSEARTRLNAACDLLRDARDQLSLRLESLRNHEANVKAGLASDDLVYFQHSVDIMQEVCQRLMIRIERLELQANLHVEGHGKYLYEELFSDGGYDEAIYGAFKVVRRN